MREVTINRSSRPEVFCKKGVLKISENSQENTCARDSFLIKFQAQACNFIKKESLVKVFSCDFCEISKNTFFLQNTSGGCFCTNFTFIETVNKLFLSCLAAFWPLKFYPLIQLYSSGLQPVVLSNGASKTCANKLLANFLLLSRWFVESQTEPVLHLWLFQFFTIMFKLLVILFIINM